MPTDVGATAKQLYAEIVLRDKTGEGAASARQNAEAVGEAFDKTNSIVERTERINASAERAYERLHRRLEPLAALQEKLERDEMTLNRAREQGVINAERYERHLAQLNDEFDRNSERLQRVSERNELAAKAVNDNEKAMRGASEAAEELDDNYKRQNTTLSTLANTTINTLGSVAGLATGVVSLKLAQKDAVDYTSRMSIALGILGRVLPIAAVAALTLTLVKLGVSGVKAIGGIVASSVQLAKVQREAEGQVTAAIASTGAAAQRTIEDIRAVANELQTLSNTADEVTIRAGAQLLTFTNIRGDNFDRTLRINNDVAARLQRDPEQTALQLGKALNDPIRNLGALTESGIQFTDGQRNLIRSLTEVGEVATAQTIILAELEKQFQGAAAAQREAEGGSIALANAWGDLKEELGDGIVDKTAASTNRLARAVGDPVWKGFFSVLGDIIGGLKSIKTEIQAGFLQNIADFLRGGASIVRDVMAALFDLATFDSGDKSNAVTRLADGFERLTGIDVSPFFETVRNGLQAIGDFVDRINGGIDGLKERLEQAKNIIPERFRRDGAERDLARGLFLGPLFAITGRGRREREAAFPNAPDIASPAALADGESPVVTGVGADALSKILDHYESLTAKAKEYYDIIATKGPEALEQHLHELDLTRRINEATEGYAPAAAAKIEAEIRAADAYDQQTEALKRNAAELEKRRSVLAELRADNDNLREQAGAAADGPEALAAVERRQDLEKRVQAIVSQTAGIREDDVRRELQINDALTARLTLEQRQYDIAAETAELRALIDAAGVGLAELDRAERRLEVEREIAGLRELAARAGEAFDEDAARTAINERDTARDQYQRLREAAYAFESDLFGVADNFVDRLVREGRLGFREMGRDLKTILLNSVLDPVRTALGNLVNGLFSFSGGGFSIFTPGINGAASSGGAGLGGFGLGGLFTPGGLTRIAAGAGGLALGGASSVFGLASLLGGGTLTQNIGVEGLVRQLGGVFGLGNSPVVGRIGEAFGAATSPLGALGGIGGSLLSGALFGNSTGQSIGSTIGGIAGGFIPVPVLGPLIGSFLGGALGSLFAGKPSNKVGQAVFDPVTGEIIGTGQKDASEASNRNLDIAKGIASAVSESLGRIADAVGADITRFFNVAAGDTDGINIGLQGATGLIEQKQTFENTEQGAEAAIAAGVKLGLANLSGGDPVLTSVVRQLAAADEPLDRILQRVDALSAALDASDEPVDAFRERLDALIDAFDGLDRSAGALKTAFDDAIDGLSASANDENRKALEAVLNPQKAQLAEQAEALTARRDALTAINAEGGNVDMSLFDDLARRQLLAGFNIDRRLAGGGDAARASVDQFRDNQRLELEALTSLVGRFGVTLEDVAALQRAQVFERRQFFNTLPEEDRLRLAGQGDEFLDLSGRYELAVDRLLEQSERLVDGFEDRARELEEIETRERSGALDYERAIREIDSAYGQGNPAQRLDIARAEVEDLRSRALVDQDTEDRRFARDQLPQAVNDLIAAGQRAGASSPLAQEALDFGRSVLVEVKDRRERDADDAARARAALEESRDLLEDIRDILASPELDAAALAEKALALPDSFGERETVISLARTVLEIQDALYEQNERIAAALEALTPEDVGLSAPVSANDNAAAAPAAFTGADANQSAPPQTATAGGGSTETSKDADLQSGLYLIAKRLEKIAEQDAEFYRDSLRRADRQDTKLARIANK